MVTVKYEDLSLAFYFVSSGAPMEHHAYISMDSGKIYWVSELAPTEDELPDDFGESDRYLEIPHKNDLDLGQGLALRFAAKELPGAYDRVAGFFGHRGAYRRFKDYLADVGYLEKWYVFEAEQIDQALRAWCEVNQILIAPEPPSA
ncbi:MAG TPA: hypothetical protein VFZ73_04825 [Gemmatimonadaceae bacterium]